MAGRLPRLGSSGLISRWLVVTIVASLVALFDGGFVARWTALVPHAVLQGQIWRLVTWPVIEIHPTGLVLLCLAIYKFGSELATVWGDRRLLRFIAMITAAAAVLTCIVALIAGYPFMVRLGGFALVDVLVIAWARQFPDRGLTLYGFVTFSGQRLVGITCAISAVYSLYVGIVWTMPELACCALAALWPASLLRRM